MTPDEKIRRAQDAQRIIESALYKEAYAKIREQLFDEWVTSTDAKNRDALWHEFKAVERVQTFFGSVITEGTLTRMAADRQRKQAHLEGSR